MKIVLQHQTTGLYYQLPGTWTGDPRSASDFRTYQSALRHLHRESMTQVQVTAVFLGDVYVDSVAYPTVDIQNHRQA